MNPQDYGVSSSLWNFLLSILFIEHTSIKYMLIGILSNTVIWIFIVISIRKLLLVQAEINYLPNKILNFVRHLRKNGIVE